MTRRGDPPDVVPDVDESRLRTLYGNDSPAVIAFRRFLQLPRVDGKVQCPSWWYAYGRGQLTSREVLMLDDLRAQL